VQRNLRVERSVDELAHAAGVSPATVYRHFDSRDELLREAGLQPDPGSRKRILAAALELVGRDGLAHLSMDELATTAGLCRASLYRLFPGKTALFRELVRVYSPMETVVAVLERSWDRPPEEVMPELARQAVGMLQGHVGMVRTILFEIVGVSPDSLEGADWAFSRGVMTLAGYITEQMQHGRLRMMHPVVALTGFIGPILLHILSRPLLERELGYDVPVEDTVQQLAENWVRSMHPE
jgi:AcrR family transcriptional regulator